MNIMPIRKLKLMSSVSRYVIRKPVIKGITEFIVAISPTSFLDFPIALISIDAPAKNIRKITPISPRKSISSVTSIMFNPDVPKIIPEIISAVTYGTRNLADSSVNTRPAAIMINRMISKLMGSF
jgi:hypothetical protein